MSATSFHRHFRAITWDTPLFYRRRIRLLDARRQIVSGARVTDAAFAVGYGSASQFSREYKRVFGTAPASDRPAAHNASTPPLIAALIAPELLNVQKSARSVQIVGATKPPMLLCLTCKTWGRDAWTRSSNTDLRSEATSLGT